MDDGMNLEKMRERKKQLRLTNQEVAERSGVPLGTVNKIFSGATRSPKYSTVTALEAVLGMGFYRNGDGAFMGCEEKADGGGGFGGYTVKDYYALQSRARVELIDGKYYPMGVWGRLHQEILGELFYQIRDYIGKKRKAARVYMAPFGVRLDRDDRTVVRPGLCVVCQGAISGGSGTEIEGAPDFMAEVICEKTDQENGRMSAGDGHAFGDKFSYYAVKLRKYWNAGVGEYWLIDPVKGRIMAYRFRRDEMELKLYGMGEKAAMEAVEGLEIDLGRFVIKGRMQDAV